MVHGLFQNPLKLILKMTLKPHLNINSLNYKTLQIMPRYVVQHINSTRQEMLGEMDERSHYVQTSSYVSYRHNVQQCDSS